MKIINKYKINNKFVKQLSKKFWFIPPDALLRAVEANIWSNIDFRSPTLDIGVGDGEMSEIMFNKRNIEVGIDPNNKELENVRKKNIYKKVLCASAEKMPFKNGFFNTVISNSTFEHIAHDSIAVSEVARVLKKGGRFYLTVPSVYLPKWIYEEEENTSDASLKLKEFNKRVCHYRYRTVQDWERLFNNNKMGLSFYSYYYSKEVTTFWYFMIKFFTKKFRKKEFWSYFAHSKISFFIPKHVASKIVEKALTHFYKKAHFASEGAMLFMVAVKK